jgi:GUN4-like
VIESARTQGQVAADLADRCLREYPRAIELTLILKQQLQKARYAKLEALMRAGNWREADEETYRLMITTVGKEEGEFFSQEDLETFPCEDLRTLDDLWVTHSGGKFGFSVQQKIWQDWGSPTQTSKRWNAFCVRVGWKNSNARKNYVNYSDFKFNPSISATGELPWRLWGLPFRLEGRWSLGVGVSCIAQRLIECSSSGV